MRSLGFLLTAAPLGLACASTPVAVRTGDGPEPPPSAATVALPVERGPLGEAEALREGVWDPAYFDELLRSDHLEIEGLDRRHRREGTGVPLVGLRERTDEDPAHFPPEGITRPLTAVTLRSDDAGASLVLLDPTRHDHVEIDGERVSLAADFTAPYAVLLSRTVFHRTAIRGAFDYSEIEEQAGIYLLEPYDPDQIPLLMIHGLLSSPNTWLELTNEVLGSDELRAKYQVWHAIYPTGIPFLHAAADVRGQLAALRAELDPEGDDFATRNIVVVAHSKGGLLTKTLVSTSGEQLWDTVFTVAPEELEATPEDLAEMERFLFFERNPAVRRAIFIATPHRGSRLADNALARFLASWVVLPGDRAETFERVLRDNQDHLEPGYRFRLAGLPSGPRALSERDPLIQALADLPVDPAVPFHPILGQQKPGLLSDGVVEHASSHQEGAESEKVVEGAGHDVHRSPEAIAEVVRILVGHRAEPSAPVTVAAPVR